MVADNLSFRPIGAVLSGLELMELPEGYTPLEVVAVIKAIDEDGDVCWHTRYTKAPHAIEFLGALHAAVALMTTDIRRDYEPDGPEDI